VGEKVRVRSNGLVGEVPRVSGKNVTISVGNISSTMKADTLERISSTEFREISRKVFKPALQKVDASISSRKLNFSPEIDIRGARLADALDIVTHFIDDAIMLSVGQVRIIHGKGTGVLHEEIQKYLRTIPGVGKVSDEDVRTGGSGVTIVTLE
jgi:DNA mismatch repair protein MutS2